MAAKKKSAKRKTAKKRTSTKRPAQKRAAKRAKATTPKVGTTLKREFKGTEHTVKVTADGFAYMGETYRTLTAAAKAITGYASVSGPRFFGLDAASQKGGSK
jgi:hypothetical protein